MEDGKGTVSILNIEDLDDTSDVQSIVTIPDKEPTQSTSGCNKRRNSDDEKTLNKIAKTEQVRKNKKTNFSSEYLKIANKNLDVQIHSRELRIREVVALERICNAIENASKAQFIQIALHVSFLFLLTDHAVSILTKWETSVKIKAIGKTWKAFWPYFDQEVEH
nr:uncharacterized protein LOC124809416 [Hydra vulgaris]